jgi:ribonucleoside-triphosphate reductase
VDSRLGIQDGWDPIRKIRFESRFLPYSTGGQIVFTEWPSMVHNLTALEAIWDFAYDNDIYYMGVNFPVDQCFECGFVGEMSCTNQGYCCPKCNNSDLSTINCVRRLCGYLGEPAHRPVNIGKQQQILGRAKHI